MTSLEVRNPEIVYENFEAISVSVRTVPSTIMIAVTSKLIIIFVFNVFIFVGVIIFGWKVADNSKHQQVLRRQDFSDTARRSPEFAYTDRSAQSQQATQMISNSDDIRNANWWVHKSKLETFPYQSDKRKFLNLIFVSNYSLNLYVIWYLIGPCFYFIN